LNQILDSEALLKFPFEFHYASTCSLSRLSAYLFVLKKKDGPLLQTTLTLGFHIFIYRVAQCQKCCNELPNCFLQHSAELKKSALKKTIFFTFIQREPAHFTTQNQRLQSPIRPHQHQ